jgi:NAD(P)-dependent dehydrogenase (short-subunit alcohol dehydrogenase family)
MNLGLDGRVCVVTGATRGIGAATARMLAQEGARVLRVARHDADLELDVADLASAYLGAFTFTRLAAAGRVRELEAGALARADALFRTPRPPYCPEDF